jgi:hypothetical protein
MLEIIPPIRPAVPMNPVIVATIVAGKRSLNKT